MNKENYDKIIAHLDKRIKSLEGDDELKSLNESVCDERIARELREIRKLMEDSMSNDYKRCVAIICNSTAEFREWKKCFALVKNVNTKKFIANETLYIAILRPEDICGYNFDDTICLDTDKFESEVLSSIYRAIKLALTPKK